MHSDTNSKCQRHWLEEHISKMYFARTQLKQATNTAEERILKLEAAANADSVLELIPQLFRRDEGRSMMRITETSCYAIAELERIAYEALKTRAGLDGNGDTFTDTGKRYFR